MTASFLEARVELERTDRSVADKRMSADAAIERFVHDGDHVAIGGTLYSRTPMALVFAILRSAVKDLAVSRPLMCYEGELLLATGQASRIVTSWVGIGLRWGLARVLRQYVEAGAAVYEEWSHLGIGLRYKAGAMGVPFLPTLTMLGSDLAKVDGVASVECPYTGARLAAVPSLTPDVALIHAHRADMYGNVQVDGYRHMDVDMARAARRVIVSAETIISPEEIARDPSATMLPHFAVDAVVPARFGAYPNECYGLYEPDLAHFESYVDQVKAEGADGARRYVDRCARPYSEFSDFLEAEVRQEALQDLSAAALRLMP